MGGMTFMQDGDLASALAGYGKKANRFDARRRYGLQLIQQGADTSPVQSPWQGVGRLAQALAGGIDLYMADRDEKDSDKKRSDALAQAMAEPDPQKRIGLLSAYDPDIGARGSVQLAVEQAKQQQAAKALREGATGFGAAYGAPQGPQQATGMPTPLPTGQTAPGGFANNLGNIRATNIGWSGKGAPHNGFETFGSPQDGANAMFKNLGAYVQANPGMTVAQAIAKWAPPNENDTGGYIKRLAEATGINPGMPLAEVLKDPAVAATLMDGIARIEKGGLPQGATADTFMAAAGGPGQASPGVPGQIAQPPQIAQGDGTPPQPNPAGNGPAVIAPPGVPDVPRPQPSPQQIQQFHQRIASQEFGTGPDAISRARAALDADLDRQWSVDRERAKMQFEQNSGDYRDARKNQGELDRAAPMELIKQRTKNYEENIRPKAEAAVSEISAIHQMRQLLDAGAITGTGADARMAMQRFAQTIGIDWGTDQVANTVALQSAVGQRVLALVKNLGAGSGISNADREYAAKIAGGEISMTEPSMRRVMDIGERAARATLRNHDGEVARLRKLNGMGNIPSDYFGVPAAPTYDEWKAANPPPGAPPAGQAAPGIPGQTAAPPPGMQPNGFATHPNPNAPTNMADPLEGKTATNPQTGQKIMRRGGQWVPVQ